MPEWPTAWQCNEQLPTTHTHLTEQCSEYNLSRTLPKLAQGTRSCVSTHIIQGQRSYVPKAEANLLISPQSTCPVRGTHNTVPQRWRGGFSTGTRL